MGVALEYERMGNRPVSEGLQARADGHGFEFEHLGIAIGTVIHGIDLRRTDSPERSGVNDYRIFLMQRGPKDLPQELVDKINEEIPFGVSHPILRTHPETGKTGLYIHGGFLRHDSLYDARTNERLDTQDSRAIVRELLQGDRTCKLTSGTTSMCVRLAQPYP